jgi:lipopolysaccharide/colanic/teichoic acid biosynthesis glycosyltransferase
MTKTNKRVFDLTMGLITLLILLGPIIVIAIIVAIDQRKFPIFRQLRAGKNNEPFWILKFLTIVDGIVFNDILETNRKNQAKTTFTRFLRDSRIDEWPQVINIILGQMSFLGPRPHALCHVVGREEKYLPITYGILPGLFSPGKLVLLMDDQDFEGARRADTLYFCTENQSIWKDAQIVICTIKCLVTPKHKRRYYIPKSIAVAA